jgi:hypothetical protein
MRAISDIDHVLFENPLVTAGVFRCRPWHPRFENTGPITGHLIVFLRTSVCITHRGGQSIVTDSNLVMFYNDRQHYRRTKVSDRGDLCEWFAFDQQIVAEAIGRVDPHAPDRQQGPFTLTHGPSDAQTYLLQRLVGHLMWISPFDSASCVVRRWRFYARSTKLIKFRQAWQTTH